MSINGSTTLSMNAVMNKIPIPNQPCLLMLDFDGTLVQIASRPEEVKVPHFLPQLLTDLKKSGHQVVIVTGRREKDIINQLQPASVPTVGLHGLEGLLADSHERNLLLDQALNKLQLLQKRYPQILIEDKEFIIAVHTRQVPKHLQKTAALASLIVCSAFADDSLKTNNPIGILHGHHIVELRPLKASKAFAVKKLIKANANLFPIYIGDDTADEEAFAAMPKNSICIRVTEQKIATKAKHCLANPEAVHNFLQKLLKF